MYANLGFEDLRNLCSNPRGRCLFSLASDARKRSAERNMAMLKNLPRVNAPSSGYSAQPPRAKNKRADPDWYTVLWFHSLTVFAAIRTYFRFWDIGPEQPEHLTHRSLTKAPGIIDDPFLKTTLPWTRVTRLLDCGLRYTGDRTGRVFVFIIIEFFVCISLDCYGNIVIVARVAIFYHVLLTFYRRRRRANNCRNVFGSFEISKRCNLFISFLVRVFIHFIMSRKGQSNNFARDARRAVTLLPLKGRNG